MTLVSMVLMFWVGAAARNLTAETRAVSRPGNFVDLLVSEISGPAPVPVPDLHSSLVTDLHVEVLLGQAVVKRSTDSVRGEIAHWPVPQVAEATFSSQMEEICKAPSVDYQLFVLRMDVGSTAILGDLLGMGRKLNDTHVQVGYAFARAAGTLVQQRKRVGYSCCKQHFLGICVDHSTCHKEVDRGDTVAELQEVTATLHGCLKHQVQHLKAWFPGYDDCNTQASCEAASPTVKGCGAATATAQWPASILASSDVVGQVPLPSEWFGTQPWMVTGGWSPWDNFQKAIQSVAKALQSIIGALKFKTSSKLVKEETCMGFEHYRQNVSVLTLKCLKDEYLREAILKLLKDDLLWFFKGDEDKMAGLLIGFEHTSSANWTEFVFNVQSTSMMTPRYLSVYKNKEKGATCSNWVIVRTEANIQLAPDLFFWEKSTSRWGGLFSDDETVIQQVPHKLSPSDVWLLRTFFKAVMYMELADTIGVSYTMPKLPQCTDAVVV